MACLREFFLYYSHDFSNLRNSLSCALTTLYSLLGLLDFLCSAYILRILSWKSKRVWTIWRCLSWRNELICCSNRIMNLWNHLKEHILRKRTHCRPVLNVWSELDFNWRICHSMAVKYTVLIYSLVKEIFWLCKVDINIRCWCKEALVCCCCSDWTCIHECHWADLSVLYLRTLSVREVSCWMTDRECVVGRCISCTKARSAESSLYDCTCLKKLCYSSVFHKLHVYWSRCRVNTQCKLVCSDWMSV